jgi:hypothetical protein
MKNIFFIIVLITAFVGNVTAQKGGLSYRKKSTADNSFHIGAVQGVVASWYVGDEFKDKGKLGMTGGIFARRFLNKKYSLQLEVLYTEKGSRYYAKQDKTPATESNDYFTAPTYGYLLRLNYIEFPLLFQYNIPKINVKGLTAEFGFAYGFLVRSEEYRTEPGYNRLQYGPAFNYGEVTSHIGARYLHSTHFGLALRFSRGITPTRDYFNGEKATLFKPGQMNSSISITLFYQLHL